MRFPFPARPVAIVFAIVFAIAIAATPGASDAAGFFDIILRTPQVISFETTFAAPGGAVHVEATLRYDERGRIAGFGASTVDGAGVDLAVRGALRSRDGEHFYAFVLRGVSAAGESVLIKIAGDLGASTALASYRGPAGRVTGAPAEMSFRLDEQPAVLLVFEPDVDCSGRIGGVGVIFGGFEIDGMSTGDLAGKIDVRRGRLKWKLAAGRRKIIFRGTIAANGFAGIASLRLAPEKSAIDLFVPFGNLRSRGPCPDLLPNAAPSASAGPDREVAAGDTVLLDGRASADPDGDAISWTWSLVALPPRSAAALSSVGSETASFTADVPGDYVARLVVSDGIAASAPDDVVITVPNAAPVADIVPLPPLHRVGDTIALDGRGSSDADGDPLEFVWSLALRPPASAAAIEPAGSPTPSFVIDSPGAYRIELIVSDGLAASAPASVVVATENSPPVAIAGPNQVVRVGDLVLLDGTESYDVDGDRLSYEWTFAARPIASNALLSETTVAAPTFTADVEGPWTLQLLVGDGKTVSIPDTVRIDVLPRS